MDSFLFVIGYKLGEVLGILGVIGRVKIHISDRDKISEEIGKRLYMVVMIEKMDIYWGIWLPCG